MVWQEAKNDSVSERTGDAQDPREMSLGKVFEIYPSPSVPPFTLWFIVKRLLRLRHQRPRSVIQKYLINLAYDCHKIFYYYFVEQRKTGGGPSRLKF